ncbi:MAG: MoxR family ATPase [Actinomycetota bacterium]|nr:MoxR family ATPase [Actinomycetota bacterium]
MNADEMEATPAAEASGREALDRIRGEVAKAVIGQHDAVRGLLIALLVRGHVLLEGVPGVAKTLLASAFARSLDLSLRRLQFTPDLMPSDVTGNVVYEAGTGEFRFRAGPVFANVLLADEINRTPPKTQAALLEAMEERHVTVEGERHPLPEPFLVVATQNPVEYEGTYPLPEAQLDRFLVKVLMGYPSDDDERAILRVHDRGDDPHDLGALGVGAVAGRADLDAGRSAVTGVEASEALLGYIVSLADATRRSPSLSLGVSPRGAAMLLRTAKAAAWMDGRDFATPDDVKAALPMTWRHRVILRPEVEIEGGRADAVLGSIVDRVAVPR